MSMKSLFRISVAGKVMIAGSFVLSFCTQTMAQENSDSSAVAVVQGTMEDLPAKPFRMPSLMDVGGSSPFLTPEYRQGSVELGQGRVVSNVPIKFNTFNNAIMVIREGQELKLEFFESVYYNEPDHSGKQVKQLFRAGYPEIENHSENTIYQVLSMGPKLHLLKFIDQKVEDVPTLGDYSRREIVTNEHYYLYVPGVGIKRIKNLKSSRQSILEVLPDLGDRVAKIAAARKLKLKSESDIAILVEELNKP